MIFTVTQTQESPQKTWIIKNFRGHYGACRMHEGERNAIDVDVPNGPQSFSVLSSRGDFKHNYVATIHDENKKTVGMISDDGLHTTKVTYKNAEYTMYEVYISPNETWLCLYDEDMQLAATKVSKRQGCPQLEIFCLAKEDLNFILPAVLRYMQILAKRNIVKKLVVRMKKKQFLPKHNTQFISLIASIG